VRLLNAIKKIFATRNWEEDYLARSVDIYDLERRIRELDRGKVHRNIFVKENY